MLLLRRLIDARRKRRLITDRAPQFLMWKRTPEDTLYSRKHKQRLLAEHYGAVFGKNCYVADDAQVHPDELVVGDNTEIAGGAIVRGWVTIGANCSVNPYACISGRVTIGNEVRIASLASIIGFDHAFDSLDRPIYLQGEVYRGITIGDDVWIGANAVVLDGVTIGAHSVIGAGAVVTRDVDEYSVMVGNPARRLYDRRTRQNPRSGESA